MAYQSIFGDEPAQPRPPVPTSNGSYSPVVPSTGPSGYTPVVPDGDVLPSEKDEGGFGLFDFLGNVGQEVKGMAQGVTSLIGAGMHDVASGFGEVTDLALGGNNVEHTYKLDDIGMALPKALASDYNHRYGLSKFAQGDIWGGLQAVMTGLYEHPLSAIGDALMVGSAAKFAAKAGVLGETMGARVLGPRTMEAMSLTGGSEPIALSLSENPVARLGQQKLYEVMSYGEKSGTAEGALGQFIQRKVATGATDQANRAMYSLAQNAAREGGPLPILRPTVSGLMEKHTVTKLLSHMGMSINDKSAVASQQTRAVLEQLDDPTREMVSSYAMGTESPLPDMVPSNAANPGFVPTNQPPSLPQYEDVGFVHDPGVSPGLIQGAGNDTRRLGDINTRARILAPHRMSDVGDSNAVQLTVTSMDTAYDAASQYAERVGGQVVAYKSYFDDPMSSYDGIHYGVVDGQGARHDVSVATPELSDAQQHWSHIAHQIDAKEAEIESLRAEQALAVQGERLGEVEAIERQIIEIQDEVQAAEVLNSQTFNYTRRASTGEAYDPALAAVDRIRNITYNNATRYEVEHGLTYRKQLDRAFGPLRAEKWSRMMRIIEDHLAIRIQTALEQGAKKADMPPIVIDVVESVLGKNNPFTEGIFRSLIDEDIPFSTGYSIGGKEAVMGRRAIPGAPVATKVEKAVAAAPDRPFEVGETIEFPDTMQPGKPIKQGEVTRVYKTNSRVKKKDPDSWTTWYEVRNENGGISRISENTGATRVGDNAEDVVREQADDVPQMEDYEVSPAEPGREAVFSGHLQTGEKTINPDSTTFRHPRASGAEQGRIGALAEQYGGLENVPPELLAGASTAFPAEAAGEIASRLTNRLRMDTHVPLVENGEFPGLAWSDLAREQVAAGTPFPQYFPHIKSSKATGDVVMLNQHTTNVPSVIESETGRMKKWGGWLYEKGTFERDPIKAYEAMFRQVQRHIEFRDTMNKLVEKYGRQVTENELAAWDLGTHGEVLVSRNGLNGMVNSRAKMITATHEGVMARKSLEASTADALEAVTQDALDSFKSGVSNDEIWALPKYVAEQMKRSAKLQMPGTFNFYYDSAMGLWKSSVLSLSPRWVINNTLGNMVYMGIKQPTAIPRMIAQMMPGAKARFAATFGEDMLYQVERDFMHGEDLLTTTQKLARRSERAGLDFGQKWSESKLYDNPVTGGIRNISKGVRRLNQEIEGAARRGVAIDAASRQLIGGVGQGFMRTSTVLEKIAERGIDDLGEYGKVITDVNKVLGDYLTMSPVEAQIIRKFVIPFYAFYRHTAKFMARMPFEHPLKFQLLQRIADVDRQLNPYMPDYMLGSTNIGGAWVNFGGGNPLKAVSEMYGPSITNPMLGLAIQRVTGTNPFGKPYFAPEGQTVELFGGQQYAVQRDDQGQVIGVKPMEGNWMPPLYESLLGILPQAGLIPGFDPFERSAAKRIAGPLTGLSINTSYDPAREQYYSITNQLEALKQAMGT